MTTSAQSGARPLAMVLLAQPNELNAQKVVEELRTTWGLIVDDSSAGDTTSVLGVDDYSIMMALIAAPIPGSEIAEAAGYNYFWHDAEIETATHSGHIILSILNAGRDPIRENLLLTKLVCAVLNSSSSLGVYLGGRSLLIKKDFYLEQAEGMSQHDLPLYNWIYFGLRKSKGRQSIYTYGMSEFGKAEMEIVDSKHTAEDISTLLYDVAHYVLASDVVLQSGQTIGGTGDQKLRISSSKGIYLPDTTLKIEY